MAFITTLLVRWGLGAVVPYVMPGLIGLLVSSGLGAAWWFGYGDLPTLLLVGSAIVLTGLIFTLQSQFLKLLALAGIIILCFAYGRHVEGQDVQARISNAVDKAVADVHDQYAKAAEAEKERQRREEEQAQKRAEEEREAYRKQIKELSKALEEAIEAAARDEHAKRPALSLGAVERLNAFRRNPE